MFESGLPARFMEHIIQQPERGIDIGVLITNEPAKASHTVSPPHEPSPRVALRR